LICEKTQRLLRVHLFFGVLTCRFLAVRRKEKPAVPRSLRNGVNFFPLALRFRRFTHHHHHHLRHRFLLRFLLLVRFDDSTDCGSRKRASYALYVAEFGEIWPEIKSLNCERAGTGFFLATGSLPKLCSFLQVDHFTKAKLSCLFVYFLEYMYVCMYFCLRLRKV